MLRAKKKYIHMNEKVLYFAQVMRFFSIKQHAANKKYVQYI